MSASWLVIDLSMGYSGVEIEEGAGLRSTKIRVPFGTAESAESAMMTIEMSVRPAQVVIPDTVVTEGDDDDHDQQF